MATVPLNKDGDANAYDSSEDQVSRDLLRADRKQSGSLRITPALGAVRIGTGSGTVMESTRRTRITAHDQTITENSARLETLMAEVNELADDHEAEKKKLEDDEVEAALKGLQVSQGDEAALDELCTEISLVFKNCPALLPRLQSRGFDMGVPAEEEIRAAIKLIEEMENKHAALDLKLINLRRENEELKVKLQAQSADGSQEETVESRVLLRVAGVDFGADLPVETLVDIYTLADDLAGRKIARGAERWLKSLQIITHGRTGQSAREIGMWLFSQVHKGESDFSLADVHAFAVAISYAPEMVERYDTASEKRAICDALAFFHHFILGLVRIMRKEAEDQMDDQAGCNPDTALMFLRSLELLLLHLPEAESGYRLDALTIYTGVARLLTKPMGGSNLIRGLGWYSSALASGNVQASLSTCLLQTANCPLSFDNIRLMSNGEDLILINGEEAHLINRSNYSMEMDVLSGLRFAVDGFPGTGDVWRSPWVGLSHIGQLVKEFGPALDRLGRGAV